MNGSKKFQSKDLFFYALLAKTARCRNHKEAVTKLNNFTIYSYVKLHTINDTEFLLLVQKGILHIVFRGTEFEWSDILSNIKTEKKKIYNIEVHKGYCNKLFSSGVIREIGIIGKKLGKKYPISKIVIIGHSMGGALAQLLTYFLMAEEYYDRIECVTFGSTKPFGNSQLLPITTDVEIKNYQIKKDYVRYFPFGFANCGGNYFISSEGDITSDQGQKGYKIFPSALWSLFVNKRHSIDEYIKRISFSLLEGGYER